MPLQNAGNVLHKIRRLHPLRQCDAPAAPVQPGQAFHRFFHLGFLPQAAFFSLIPDTHHEGTLLPILRYEAALFIFYNKIRQKPFPAQMLQQAVLKLQLPLGAAVFPQR